jgi:hypothetical protein
VAEPRSEEPWAAEIETLEAIAQDDGTRELFLRMATMSAAGGLPAFLQQLLDDDEVDAETAGSLAELASDPAFLHAVEDYVHRTALLH